MQIEFFYSVGNRIAPQGKIQFKVLLGLWILQEAGILSGLGISERFLSSSKDPSARADLFLSVPEVIIKADLISDLCSEMINQPEFFLVNSLNDPGQGTPQGFNLFRENLLM